MNCDSEESERESPQMVHLVFGNGKWPEDPTKLLDVYEDDGDAELAAKDAEDDWHNTYVKSEEVRKHYD